MTDVTPLKFGLLDHGYLTLIETWGSDQRIVEAARMSTQKGFEGWGGERCPQCNGCGSLAGGRRAGMVCDFPRCKDGFIVGDEKLLKYLYEHKHATPFEMAGMVIEVQAPIFVFREWHRHRTQSYNEASSRYEPLPDLNYVPTVERLMLNAADTKNKQAGTIKGAAVLTVAYAESYRKSLGHSYADAQLLYEEALRIGVPKELARVHLPVGRYSRMRASVNLRNWLAFLTLRMDPAAQWEIQQYANAVASLIALQFPRTHELFTAGR